MKMKIKPYERKVAYYETDRMGIVHHSNYIRWLEEARIYFLEEIGIPYDVIERDGIMIPVLSAECKYRLPFRFGDTFIVHMKVTKFNGIKMELDYEIYLKGDEQLHSTGHTSHCFVNMDFKPFLMKKEYPDIYNKLLEQVEESSFAEEK